MVNEKYSKSNLKRLYNKTIIDENKFLSYRRQDDPSKRVTINDFTFDN